MPLLTIIVVSYNTEKMTLECLKSIYEQTSQIDFKVIVVDNNSSDNSVNLIKQQFPQADLIALNENIGFARANNLAASHAESKYLLLLNPDTIVLENAIEKLINFAEQYPKAGIWGGRTLYGDYSLNPTSCWRRITIWSLICRALHLTTFFPQIELFNPEGYGSWQRDSVRKVDIVTGCFFLVYRELWDQLNGFDKDFFMYGEEADLCFRAKEKGYQPSVTPTATIIHYGGASEKKRQEQILKLFAARALLVKKHWNPSLVPIGKYLMIFFVIVRICLLRFYLLFKREPKFEELLMIWFVIWKERTHWANGSFDFLEKFSKGN